MKKKPFNWNTYITLIGVVVICFIIFTDTVDTMYILPVLGVICLAYGIFGLIQAKNSNDASIVQRSILQIVLGAFVIFLGMIETLHMNLSQNFWNAFLVVIVILLILSLFMRRRK
jgi:peptidoglycan/LPS O-acetylase OafA/YrhL